MAEIADKEIQDWTRQNCFDRIFVEYWS